MARLIQGEVQRWRDAVIPTTRSRPQAISAGRGPANESSRGLESPAVLEKPPASPPLYPKRGLRRSERRTKQIESESEQIERESELIENESELIRNKTEPLKRESEQIKQETERL